MDLNKIEDTLRAKSKPKEKQSRLVDAVCKEEISMHDFLQFFQEASDVDKGTSGQVGSLGNHRKCCTAVSGQGR